MVKSQTISETETFLWFMFLKEPTTMKRLSMHTEGWVQGHTIDDTVCEQ